MLLGCNNQSKLKLRGPAILHFRILMTSRENKEKLPALRSCDVRDIGFLPSFVAFLLEVF